MGLPFFLLRPASGCGWETHQVERCTPVLPTIKLRLYWHAGPAPVCICFEFGSLFIWTLLFLWFCLMV